MATRKSRLMSDEITNIKCCVCLVKNRTREADMYFVHCRDYYCSPCTDKHKKYPATKEHIFLDKADFRSLGPDGSLPSFVTQRCAQHQMEVTSMYCKEHNEVACSPCIAIKHRSCANIYYIPDDIDKLYSRIEVTNVKQKINKSKETLTRIKAAKENEIEELKELFEIEVESVNAFRQDLETLLDNIQQETIRELKHQFEKIESRLTSEITGLNKLIFALNEVSSEFKKSEGNTAQEFVNVKSSWEMVTKAEDAVEVHQRKSDDIVRFSADQNIKNFLQQVKAIGRVSCNKQETTIIRKENRLHKVKHQTEINVKLVNETSVCDIGSSCLTEDDLLLTDYTNKKLKRIDMSTETLKDYLDLEASPHSVCLVSKTESAVTLNNKTVQFVSLRNKLTATQSVKMNHYCFGIAYTDGMLYISDIKKTIFISDIEGKELKRISTYATGNEIFDSTRHLIISAGGDRVFVADTGKSVVILDVQGNYLTTLTDPTLS